ncbi:uncharacterized protein LOC127535483, partial [Acanthochromis polyacanthus]|uniref:uncharacterized protein LOC127535483 n=1 Tax=Acanthochromis polyacanthus TaxID=80966 RepID=UPI002234A352
MDLFALKSFLLLLLFTGRCTPQDILPAGPVNAVLGHNVTLTTLLVDKPNYAFISWSFSDGKEQVPVATVGSQGLKPNAAYEGRVSINTTNGALSLSSLKAEDSGVYSISIIAPDGTTDGAEIKLQVLQCKGEDKVMQPSGDVIAAEGDTVTLDCTFESSSTAQSTLFWYKQEVNGFPKYILRRGYSGADNAEEFHKDRFNAELKKTSVPLNIQKLHLSDSAVYYCALQPTVTGNSETLYKNLWSKDNRKPHNIYMLRRGDYGGDDNAPEFQEDRFDAEFSKTSVPLKIQKLHLSDSAVYYCALRPTV